MRWTVSVSSAWSDGREKFPADWPCAGVVQLGGPSALDGKVQHMNAKGRVLNTKGEPIPDAIIETWETDEMGASFRHAPVSLRPS
jgi:hypothetical protein